MRPRGAVGGRGGGRRRAGDAAGAAGAHARRRSAGDPRSVGCTLGPIRTVRPTRPLPYQRVRERESLHTPRAGGSRRGRFCKVVEASLEPVHDARLRHLLRSIRVIALTRLRPRARVQARRCRRA